MSSPVDGVRPHPSDVDRIVGLALDCIHREYPHHLSHLMTSDEDARPPRVLHPTFHGCFDWHSAVHAHWLLVRMLRCSPVRGWEPAARAALARSLTPGNLHAERLYLDRPDRAGFERPYGLAWLLLLATELSGWPDPAAGAMSEALEPLAMVAADRIGDWIVKLTRPIRSGEHDQTAFALGLALDARVERSGSHSDPLVRSIRDRALAFYGDDRDAPWHLEPSGHDFLSPSLGEADLMRRILEPAPFARWLDGFLPGLDGATALFAPVRPADRGDGKLSHLDGLNLSRAWMLEGLARSLPAGDPRRPVMAEAGDRHGREGLAAVTGEHYSGGHWLGTFAGYWLTRRGDPPARAG